MTYHYIGPSMNFFKDGVSVKRSSIQECFDFLKDIDTLGLDIETSRKYQKGKYNEEVYKPGLDPYVSRIVMLQIGTKDDIFVIDTRTEDITPLFPLFTQERIWVGHNLKFEARFLYVHYGLRLYKIWDTMLVEMNLYNGLPKGFSLEALAKRYLGSVSATDIDLFSEEEVDAYIIDKSTRLGFINIGNKTFTETQVIYGGDDIFMPLSIMEKQKDGIIVNGENYNPTVLHDLEHRFCLCLADIENLGIPFNPESWKKVAETKNPIYLNRLSKINKYVEQNYPMFTSQGDLFNPGGTCNIEWSSPQQVVKLFKAMGICPQEKSKQTKKMEYTVGAKSLTKLLPANMKEMYEKDKDCEITDLLTFTLNYLLFKKTEQAITTFGVEWLKNVHPITGRVHSSFRQILNTGRISSTKPNLQNIPHDKQYRYCIEATNGHELITADYASQELRILAEIANDASMLSFFNDGHPIFKDDYHSFIATKIFSLMRNEPDLIITKDTHPDERQTAKSLNFKIAYGGSAYTLKDDFGVEEEVAQEFIDNYYDAIPSLRDNFALAKEMAVELGYIIIDTYTNRIWHDKNFEEMKAATKKAWSYYPDNYRRQNPKERAKTKERINRLHPDIKGLWSKYFTLKGKLERNALNYRIQGLAGGMTKMAAILIREHHIKYNTWDKFALILLIHDETLTESFDKEYSEMAKNVVEDAMQKAGTYFCKNVIMKADASISDKWDK